MNVTSMTDSLKPTLEYYTNQGVMTAPGEYEYLYQNLPEDLTEILKVLQGVLTHIFHAH